MVKEENWIDRRLSEARKPQQSTVTDAVGIRMTDLLKGKLGAAPLSPNELTETAKALIADMSTPAASEVQSSDEN